MAPAQRLVAYLTLALMAALIGGLIARRYYRLCYSIGPYVGATLLADLLILAWPATFFTWTFWTAKTTLIALLRLAIALELGTLIFQAFPGARATARFTLGLGLLALIAGLYLPIDPPPPSSSTEHAVSVVAGSLHPRLSNGAAVLFAMLWVLVLYYRVPLHPWHLSILAGIVPYLMVFTLAVKAMDTLGWGTALSGMWESAAYLLLMAFWNWAVWRKEPPPPADPRTVALLQPWRARLARP